MRLERQHKRNCPTLTFHVMKFAVQDFQKNSCNLTNDEYNQVYQHANEEMLLHQIILSSSDACCAIVPDDLIECALQAVIAEYSSNDEFHDMLTANKLQLSEYRQSLHNDLRVETILGKVAATVQTVPQSEISRYYLTNKMQFRRPEQRKVSIIQLFANTSAEEEQSFLTISEIYNRLSFHPENFSIEARHFSECDTNEDGGKIGILGPGELCQELDSVLFSLNSGDISEVVKTSKAYHILKCDAIFPAIHVPFEEAKVQIGPLLLKKKQLNACRLWLQKLVQGTKET